MKHQFLLYFSLFIVLTFVVASLGREGGITGSAIVSDPSGDSRAFLLNDEVSSFFTVDGVVFPPGECSTVAKDMYRDLALAPIDVITGFASPGYQRIASLNFVINRIRRYGTLDMVRGKDLLRNYGIDAMLSINVESVVAVPKSQRTNFFSMDLLGDARDKFYVHRGRFSTPSFNCAFMQHKGNVACDCVAHPISGIEVAGITGVLPTKDYFETVRELLKGMESTNDVSISEEQRLNR